MLETLYPLFGYSLESNEIKKIFADWKVELPTKITCTPNNTTVKTKIKKDGVLLYFGKGGNSKYLKPILAKTKNSFIGIFTMIEIDKKCRLELPFKISNETTLNELTKLFDTPKVDTFMGESKIWRKNFTDKLEIIITKYTDNEKLNSIVIAPNYDENLNTTEDYEKAGL